MKFTLSKTASQSILTQALKTCNVKARGEADSEFLIFYDKGDLFIRSVNDTAEQTIKLRAHEIDAERGHAERGDASRRVGAEDDHRVTPRHTVIYAWACANV
jgi:hypothetical protein